MTVIARGRKQVTDFQRVLFGSPSRESIRASRAALNRYYADRFAAQCRDLKETALLAQPLRELVFGHIPKNDQKLRKSIEANQKAYERKIKRRIKPPKLEKFEAEIRLGSIQAVRVPPYDDDWAGPDSASRIEAAADKKSGTYHLQIGSVGEGLLEVHAGICVQFPAPVDDARQRVAALIDYSDFWMDDAFGYGARNDFTTTIWVWGDLAQGWVNTQTNGGPQWSDGVGWFESHGNGDGDSGRVTAETFFPAFANSWYTVWVTSQANVYADGGVWGNADSFTHFDASVPLIVFGSL